MGDGNRSGDKTRQFCLVSTQFLFCNSSVSKILRIRLLKTWKLETGPRQDKRQRQSCLVCVGGVNKLFGNAFSLCDSLDRRTGCSLYCHYCGSVKSKVIPYSITSVGHGANPSLLAVSPQVTFSHKPGIRLPLLSTVVVYNSIMT